MKQAQISGSYGHLYLLILDSFLVGEGFEQFLIKHRTHKYTIIYKSPFIGEEQKLEGQFMIL